MKNFHEVRFKWNKIGSWRDRDPFTIYFVYPAFDKPFVVKGGSRELERWKKQSCWYPCFIRYTYWYRGKSRGGWFFHNCGRFYLSDWWQDNLKKYGKPYVIYENNKIIAKLRKVPNAFPKAVKERLPKNAYR